VVWFGFLSFFFLAFLCSLLDPSWPFIFINFFIVCIHLFTSLVVDLQYRNEKTRKAAFLSYHFLIFIYQEVIPVPAMFDDGWWGDGAVKLNIINNNSSFRVNGIFFR